MCGAAVRFLARSAISQPRDGFFRWLSKLCFAVWLD
jgi:hypothetical protein